MVKQGKVAFCWPLPSVLPYHLPPPPHPTPLPKEATIIRCSRNPHPTLLDCHHLFFCCSVSLLAVIQSSCLGSPLFDYAKSPLYTFIQHPLSIVAFLHLFVWSRDQVSPPDAKLSEEEPHLLLFSAVPPVPSTVAGPQEEINTRLLSKWLLLIH